jgi:hypothetical protein
MNVKIIVFWILRVAWKVQILIRFPAMKPGLLILKYEAEKNRLSYWARFQKAIGGIYFAMRWRAETLQPGLEFEIIKPRLESGIFKYISWLNALVFFGGDDRGFLKEGVETYLIALILSLNLPTFFFCIHIYSLRCNQFSSEVFFHLPACLPDRARQK